MIIAGEADLSLYINLNIQPRAQTYSCVSTTKFGKRFTGEGRPFTRKTHFDWAA